MKVALIQTNPQDNLEHNVNHMAVRLLEAVQAGADVLVLPEMWHWMGDEKGRWVSSSLLGEGPFSFLSQQARRHKVWIVGGSLGEKVPSLSAHRVFNTCPVYNPRGELVHLYRKLHLFSLRDATGRPLYEESRVFLPGAPGQPFALMASDMWWAQVGICYDLRFPEFFRSAGADAAPGVCFLPAAFTHQTGQDHWEVLLRARAIENQCWVVACNQTGYWLGGQLRLTHHSRHATKCRTNTRMH